MNKLFKIEKDYDNKIICLTFSDDKIDIDQFPSIAAEYGVRGVPTLAVFKKGEMLYKESGVHDVNRLTDLLKRFA